MKHWPRIAKRQLAVSRLLRVDHRGVVDPERLITHAGEGDRRRTVYLRGHHFSEIAGAFRLLTVARTDSEPRARASIVEARQSSASTLRLGIGYLERGIC